MPSLPDFHGLNLLSKLNFGGFEKMTFFESTHSLNQKIQIALCFIPNKTFNRLYCSFTKEFFFIISDFDEIYKFVKQGDFESVDQGDFVKLFNLLWLFKKEDKNPVIYELGDGSKLTVLDTAAFYGHVEIIKGYKGIFRFNDTELNPSDDMGRTPLFWALVQGHLDVAKFYVENGYNATGKIFDTFVQRMSCDLLWVARTSHLGKL